MKGSGHKFDQTWVRAECLPTSWLRQRQFERDPPRRTGRFVPAIYGSLMVIRSTFEACQRTCVSSGLTRLRHGDRPAMPSVRSGNAQQRVLVIWCEVRRQLNLSAWPVPVGRGLKARISAISGDSVARCSLTVGTWAVRSLLKVWPCHTDAAAPAVPHALNPGADSRGAHPALATNLRSRLER